MRVEQEIANVIRFALAVVALYGFWRLVMLPYYRDRFLSKLFDLRRELFLFMTDGRISAENPAYGDLRTTLNRTIRFAESLSLTRMVTISAIASEDIEERTQRSRQHIADLPLSPADT